MSGKARRFISPNAIQFLLLWPRPCGLHWSSFTVSEKFESQFFFSGSARNIASTLQTLPTYPSSPTGSHEEKEGKEEKKPTRMMGQATRVLRV